MSSQTTPALGEATIRELQEELRGELIRPGDGVYEAARGVWNGMIDRRPALIARCTGAAPRHRGSNEKWRFTGITFGRPRTRAGRISP